MYSPLSSWAFVEEPEFGRWAGYDLPAVIVASADESEEDFDDFDEDDFDDDFDDEFEEEDDFEDDSPEEEMDEGDLKSL